MAGKPTGREPSQRQLRVGEEIRHALAEIFMRGETYIPELETTSLTVSEVRVTPDLKHAMAYVTPLGGKNADQVVEVLNEHTSPLRHEVTRRVVLKYSPMLRFKRDASFDEAEKINRLMNDPRVKRDLVADAADMTERERDA